MSGLAYQEDIWEELLDGQITAMSPRPTVSHNHVTGNIYAIFKNYLKGKPCVVFADGVDVYLTEKDIFIPDVLVVCDKNIIKKNGIHGAPDLVVEVLSPTTIKRDRGYKKDVYGKSGVKEYWLADIENRSVEVYVLKEGELVLEDIYPVIPDYLIEKMKEEEKDSIVHEFSPVLFPDLVISLEEVFENILL